MPIRPHLDGQTSDAETIRAMGLAFEMARVALRLADRGDLANQVLASKITELAKAGERDPERLCDGVLVHCNSRHPRRRFKSNRCSAPRSDSAFGIIQETGGSELFCTDAERLGADTQHGRRSVIGALHDKSRSVPRVCRRGDPVVQQVQHSWTSFRSPRGLFLVGSRNKTPLDLLGSKSAARLTAGLEPDPNRPNGGGAFLYRSLTVGWQRWRVGMDTPYTDVKNPGRRQAGRSFLLSGRSAN